MDVKTKDRLWIIFLSIYDRALSYPQLKHEYAKAVTSKNISGCTGCTINYTFSLFVTDAEDMSDEDIQYILNSNSITMPVKKTAKKGDTKKANKAVVKPKKVSKDVTTTTEDVMPNVTSIPTPPNITNQTQTLPGGIKFLYIPKRK